MVEDLITDDTRHFEALLARDRVDNHVAMDANKVFRVEDTILILERRIVSVGVSANREAQFTNAPDMCSGGVGACFGWGVEIATRCGEKEIVKVPGLRYR